MKLAVAASPEVAFPVLEWLKNSEHDLALIISRPDSQVGRGRELAPTAVASWAIENGIDLYCPQKAADFDERLKSFDLVITIGYGVLLPQYLLDQPRHGFINLHFFSRNKIVIMFIFIFFVLYFSFFSGLTACCDTLIIVLNFSSFSGLTTHCDAFIILNFSFFSRLTTS